MQQTLLNNRYEIEQKIGEGGMAAVYRGRDVRLNRRVAIKILHQQYVDDPDFLSRFQHEAQAAAILSHPSVVNVYDVGQDNDLHYIVMEYVEGENLKALINREAPLSVSQAVAIGEAVAYGLESAHRLGMVHRDIKPQNIMVTHDGHIRITDFGIAKSEFSTALTQTGTTFGTADYISPEQASGLSASPQSDIYSLGVTLYEMLSGKLPFTGDSALAVAMQHVNSEPPPLRQLNPQVPYQLEALIDRALSKEAAQRPTSAREFAHLLHYYRDMAEQQTIYSPRPIEDAEPWEGRALGTGPGASAPGRGALPPARPPMAPAPQAQNHSCGMFIVGLILLGGVLALVLILNTGMLNFDTEASGSPSPVSAVQAEPETTPTSTATRETTTPTTPTPTPTLTPSPTATPTPQPTATEVPRVTVPDIRSLPEAEARNLLAQLGLQAVNGGSANDNNVPGGQVLAQQVPPGTQLVEGSPVTYTLSLGPQLVDVPDLERLRVGDAVAEAERLGLQVSIVEAPSQQIPEGFVISQQPKNVRVRAGETLLLTVSVGDQVRFPDVIGLQREQAMQVLQSAGLEIAAIDVQDRDRLSNFDSFLPNQVISAQVNGQPVDNGDFIPRNSSVVLGVRAP